MKKVTPVVAGLVFCMTAPREARGSTPASASLGDIPHGEKLYRLHCSGCHGLSGRGDGYIANDFTPPPGDLKSPALHFSRTHQQIFDAINEGGVATRHSFTMPAYNRALTLLDVWDLVALLRHGEPSIDDLFPDGVRYAVKRYTIDDDGAKRLAGVLSGGLSATEYPVDVVSVFGHGRAAGAAAIYVPQEPKELDTLKPKEKVGYVALFEVPASEVIPPPAAAKASRKKGKAAEPPPAEIRSPFSLSWTTVPVAIAMDRDGVIKAIAVGGEPTDRDRVAPLLSSFAGQGGKRGDKRPDYKPLKGPKGGDALAKVINRLYYRGLEGAIMFDKEEAERNIFSP